MAENTPAQGQSKGKSIACMACGIASIVLSWSYGCGLIPAIVSLVLGSQCAKEGVQNTFTKVGKITGIIGLLNAYFVFLFLSRLCFSLVLFEKIGNRNYHCKREQQYAYYL